MPRPADSISAKRQADAWLTGLSFAQRQRLRFLESRLLWEGVVNRSHICEQFGLTKNHLTRDLAGYRRFFPDNLEYDVTARGYVPGSKFTPAFATSDPGEYLELLRAYTYHPSAGLSAELGVAATAEVIPVPEARVDATSLREILAGIANSTACDIRYQSFSRPESTDRTIWPKAMVWNGVRWHIRSFDELRNQHLDLVLSRMLSVTRSDAAPKHDANTDHSWECKVTINVIPNPALSVSQRRVVAREYGMTRQVWRVTLREALIPYFLQRYRLDEPTARSRIILKNDALIEKYRLPTN